MWVVFECGDYGGQTAGPVAINLDKCHIESVSRVPDAPQPMTALWSVIVRDFDHLPWEVIEGCAKRVKRPMFVAEPFDQVVAKLRGEYREEPAGATADEWTPPASFGEPEQ